jgi:hypothetical protein
MISERELGSATTMGTSSTEPAEPARLADVFPLMDVVMARDDSNRPDSPAVTALRVVRAFDPSYRRRRVDLKFATSLFRSRSTRTAVPVIASS